MDKENIKKNAEFLGGGHSAYEIARYCEELHTGCDLSKPEIVGEEIMLTVMDIVKQLREKDVDLWHSRKIIGTLNRLAHGLPLTPITDEDFEDSIIDNSMEGQKSLQCDRYPSLFKTIKDDGTVAYNDYSRFKCIDIENEDDTFTSGLVDKVLGERFPIELPYLPADEQYNVRVSFWPVKFKDEEESHTSVFQIHSVLSPEGFYYPINRMWFIDGDGMWFIDGDGKEDPKEIRKQQDCIKALEGRCESVLEKYAKVICMGIDDHMQDLWKEKMIDKYGKKFWPWQYEDEYDKYKKYRWEHLWYRLLKLRDVELEPEKWNKLVEECRVMKYGKNRHIWGLCEKLVTVGDSYVETVDAEYKDLVALINELKEQANAHLEEIAKEFDEHVSKLDPLYEKDDPDIILNAIHEWDPDYPKSYIYDIWGLESGPTPIVRK